MNYFWTNTIWYLLLNALTVFELILVLAKAKNRKFVFAYYTTISGIVIVVFEQVVYLLTRGYDYHPMFVPTMPTFDNLLGKISSQLSVSATALLVAVFDLNLFWILIFAGLYAGIEELFLALGIYKHNWYQTWMTPVSLIVYFWFVRTYYPIVRKGVKPIVHYLNIFAGLFTLFITSPVPLSFFLSGVQNYIPDHFPDPVIYSILIINLYFAVLAVSMMPAYFFKLKWRWKTAVIGVLLAVIYMAYKKWDLLWFQNDWWYLAFSISTIFWVYTCIIVLDNFYKSVEPIHPSSE